jgi:cell wall assembly regulator SMI1
VESRLDPVDLFGVGGPPLPRPRPWHAGDPGQIIELWHDEGSRPVGGDGFRAWLTEFADALEADELVLSEEDGALMRQESF